MSLLLGGAGLISPTAAAPGGVTQTHYAVGDKGSRNTANLTFAGADLGSGSNKLYIGLTMEGAAGDTALYPGTFTVDGVSGTKTVGNAEDGTVGGVHTVWYEFAAPGVTSADIVVGAASGSWRSAVISVHEVAFAHTIPVTAQEAAGTGDATSLDMAVQNGDVALLMAGQTGTADPTITWTGATKEGADKSPYSNFWTSVAKHDATGTESPRTFTCTYSATPNRRSGAGIVVRAS